MDIIGILNSIKGKVLDSANFELIQTAYELQNNNVEQLKENNSAINESNKLLKEQTEQVVIENNQLKSKVAELEAQLTAVSPKDHAADISEAALAILKQCIDQDLTNFYDAEMVNSISFSSMQAEVGIDELLAKQLIDLSSFDAEGKFYCLTEGGKKYAINMV